MYKNKMRGRIMLKYSLKRLLQSILTVVIILTVVFLLMRLLPKDGYFTDEEIMKLTADQKYARLKEQGLFDHPLKQLMDFYSRLFKGNLGYSIRIQKNIPVMKVISEKAPISIQIGLIATLIGLVLGVLLGVMQATNKGKIIDKLGTAYIVIVNAVPPLVYYFFIWVFLTSWFGLPMRLKIGDYKSYVLPILAMSLTSIASYALWIRRYMVDELNKDYIKLARAKGLPYKNIMYKHVLRNALVPMVQLIPASLLLTIGGSILIESIFSVPGMGSMLINAIQKKDNPLVQAIILLYSIMGVFGVFLGDILMVFIDPRIKLDTKGGSR